MLTFQVEILLAQADFVVGFFVVFLFKHEFSLIDFIYFLERGEGRRRGADCPR